MIQTDLQFLQAPGFDPARLDAAWLTVSALALLLLLGPALRRIVPVLSVRLRRRTGVAARRRNAEVGEDAALRAVSGLAFEPVPILRQEEALLMPLLEAAARAVGRGHRVLARTSLSEVIRPAATSGTLPERRAAAAALAAKRLDFAIIDRSGRLVAAVAYNGAAHYLADTYRDDALKREVIRRAGLLYVEVEQGFDDAEVLDRVCSMLAPQSADPGDPGDRTSARVLRMRRRGAG